VWDTLAIGEYLAERFPARKLWPADPAARALARLGFGEPFPVSALQGRGAGDLLDVVVEHLRSVSDGATPDGERLPSIALVGRPNVGKSSLFNRLVGQERAIVHEEPGTTRDALDTVADIGGRRYRFVDTAGMRRRAKEAAGPEYYGLVRSLRAIDAADVALLVIDARDGASEQDQKIARRVSDAGRAAVVVLNKWDLVGAEQADEVAERTRETLRFLPWAPMIRTSALTGRGLGKIVPAVELARASWERRVPTAALNVWLREGTERVPLGTTAKGRPARIRYVTQARARPPEFVLFATGRLTDSALRALENRLRQRFDFEGTPIRMTVRAPRRRSG
jgi:GTP-binding protein